MTSRFDDLVLTTAVPSLFRWGGDTVSYTPGGGSPQPGLTAVAMELGDNQFRRRRYCLKLSDVADSKRGDVFTDPDGETWMAMTFEDEVAGMRRFETGLCRQVTYRVAATDASATIFAIREHLPDLSPATQTPYQQRSFWIPVDALAAAPLSTTAARIDQITDVDGNVFSIFNLDMPIHGFVRAMCKIGQVRA